ncbi:hypothetical protein [Xanthovirga aplysinae]|uniref:hypothetical protein n=1 Tax=Xanthovirga aplysinae TaxID=2529853 RepID=UPI0012BCB899|nr:hypothetical protein [Xanthovirga aplysinae]
MEIEPEFPGGVKAFFKENGKNLRYPSDAFENGIEGKVNVQFVFDEFKKIP